MFSFVSILVGLVLLFIFGSPDFFGEFDFSLFRYLICDLPRRSKRSIIGGHQVGHLEAIPSGEWLVD